YRSAPHFLMKKVPSAQCPVPSHARPPYWARATAHRTLDSAARDQPEWTPRRNSTTKRAECGPPWAGVAGHGAMGTGHLRKPRAKSLNQHIAAIEQQKCAECAQP